MKFSKEFKIGAFVIAVIAASFFMINFLRGEDIFNREMELSARYTDLEGLVSSAPVYVKGYKAGKVTEIVYESETDDFSVTCSILKTFRIPSDSKMIIYGVDIMGSKGVRIEPGISATMAEDGDFLASTSEPALLDGLASEVGPIINKVGNTLDSLNAAVASVNRLLNDENIGRTLAHAERTMAAVSSVATQLEGKSVEFNAFVEDLASMSEHLVSISEKADTVMTDVSSVVSHVSGDDIAAVVASMKELLENVNDPDGTLGKLLTDDSIYFSVDSLLNTVEEFIGKVQENPKKYIRISVF